MDAFNLTAKLFYILKQINAHLAVDLFELVTE